MKTRLLTRAIALTALLSVIGGGKIYADGTVTLDFDTEKSVSGEKTWTFDDLTTETEYTSVTELNDAYLRATSSLKFTVTELGSSETITFPDGYTTNVNKTLVSSAKWQRYTNVIYTAGETISNTSKPNQTPSFSINVACAGRLYVAFSGTADTGTTKSLRITSLYDGTAYTGDAPTVSAAGGIAQGSGITYFSYDITGKAVVSFGNLTNAYTIYAVRFVPAKKVSETTTWTFSNRTTTESSVTATLPYGDGLVMRGGAISFADVAAGQQSQTINEQSVTCTQKLVLTNNYNSNPAATTAYVAGDGSVSALKTAIAFETVYPGTVYVLANFANSDANNRLRIHFSSSVIAETTTAFDTKNITGGSINEYSATAKGPGSFFISSTIAGCEIYAVRFVPSTVEQVTIGSHGMSSFSSYNALDFANATAVDASSDALKAYRASGLSSESEVILSSVDAAPAGTGLILKGTASATYNIPILASADAVGDNLLVATTTKTDVAASTTGAYHYMWAYTASKGIGFYNVATATTSAAGKAYLSTTAALADQSGGSARNFIFEDDETTGVSATLKDNGEMTKDKAFFNLAGQRVSQPQKGLYIVNGKKVVVK